MPTTEFLVKISKYTTLHICIYTNWSQIHSNKIESKKLSANNSYYHLDDLHHLELEETESPKCEKKDRLYPHI